MANLPSIKVSPIQIEETKFKAGVSEYTATRMGELINWLTAKISLERQFSMNGLVSSFVGKDGVDGIFSFPYDAQITDVIICGGSTVGTSGAHQFDIKLSTFPSGAFTSIFSTYPEIDPTAAAYASCGVGDTVTGCVAAIFDSPPINVSKGDRVRMDVISAMGGAVDASLTVKFIPR